MILIDVNVLVYAQRADMLPQHPPVRRWLTEILNESRPFAISDLVLSGFIRVVTQKPFDPPTPLDEALTFCQHILNSPSCQLLYPRNGHWQIFQDLCRAVKATGNLISDAYLAALALETDCEFVTFDRDFARFPGLRWRSPLENHPRTNPR